MKITFKELHGKRYIEITCESEAGGGQNSLTLTLKQKNSQPSSNQKALGNSKEEEIYELDSTIAFHKGHPIIQDAYGYFLVPSLSLKTKSLQEAIAAIDLQVSEPEEPKGFRSRNLGNGEIPSV